MAPIIRRPCSRLRPSSGAWPRSSEVTHRFVPNSRRAPTAPIPIRPASKKRSSPITAISPKRVQRSRGPEAYGGECRANDRGDVHQRNAGNRRRDRVGGSQAPGPRWRTCRYRSLRADAGRATMALIDAATNSTRSLIISSECGPRSSIAQRWHSSAPMSPWFRNPRTPRRLCSLILRRSIAAAGFRGAA